MSDEETFLSHEEIWDDSALLESWNEALTEYKKYHSIYVRGGSVRDLQRQKSPSEETAEAKANQQLEDAKVDRVGGRDEHGSASSGNAPRDTGMASAVPSPQMLLGVVRDDGLKQLLMSWYYAGYYTGLYEGKQQMQQEQQSQHS